MINLRFLIVLLLFIIISGVLKAQEYIMLKGSVHNKQGEALVGAHVRNITRKYGTFTDYSGNFTLVLAKKDSLKVTMVGLKPFRFRIPENLNALNYSLKITLFEDTLIISGPVISAFPATYAEFRKVFVETKTPEEEIKKKLNLPTEPFRRRFQSPEGGLVMPGPFSILYDNFSKEAKQKRKMAAINEKDNLRKEFLKIISLEIVNQRYACKTDDEIDDLIRNCGITLQMIENIPAYAIIQMVEKCVETQKY